MELRVTRNSFLGNYYAKRIKADGSFSVFSPSALDNAAEAELDVISPASLSMPLTYYIVFSSCASPKFPLFNKTEVVRLFFFFSFPEWKELRRTSISWKIRAIANEIRCYHAITVLGLSTDVGMRHWEIFPGKCSQDKKRNFGGVFCRSGTIFAIFSHRKTNILIQ